VEIPENRRQEKKLSSVVFLYDSTMIDFIVRYLWIPNSCIGRLLSFNHPLE